MDISYNIEYQKILYSNTDSKIKKNIISKRIKELKELVGNETITEYEYYIAIWGENGEEDKILKKANEWVNRLYVGNFESRIIKDNEIRKLLQSFTMPEIIE